MKLHAGSLYKDYLVLYGEEDDLGKRIIKVPQSSTQWEIYCEDVEFEVEDSKYSRVTYKNISYRFEYFISKDPMKDLGFV